jgi:membrane-bound lytic murein transglycosylase D
MDPIRSTRAAARHLRSLYRQHGDWALAAAAYNAGSGRISRGLERFAVANFWDLAQHGDLAEETRHYVPRLFAMTIIHRNRERLGISASGGDASFAFDSVHVDYETPLAVLAEIGGVPSAELSAMNPHLASGSAPAGGYWLWVPHGSGASVQQAYMDSDFRRDHGQASYVVRWGDSLSRIAQRSGLAASRIRQLNPSTDFDKLMAGATIRLPASAVRQLAAGSEDGAGTGAVLASAATASAAGREAPAGGTHDVRSGDTLWDIARAYGVSIEAIREANSLDGQVIRAGQALRIPAGERSDAGGSPSGATSIDHVVKSGDTLSEIAEVYGSSVGAIQKENGLGSGPIRPGQVLTVPL